GVLGVAGGGEIRAPLVERIARSEGRRDLNAIAFTFADSPAAEIAAAISDVNVSSRAIIDAGAAINVFGNVDVRAFNENDLSTRATAMALGAGMAGVAATFASADTSATARIDADLPQSMGVTVRAEDLTTRNRAIAASA